MPRRKRIEDAYEAQAQGIEESAKQAGQATREAYVTYEDTANKAQEQLAQQQAAARTALENRLNEGYSGVEAIIKEGEARLQREKEVANAEYLASQRAAQATGLTHLGSSIANLIGVGGFNASNQVYNNPSIDWMRKADQDRQIARQRMDNLRDRQRQIQQHLIEMKMNGAGQLANMDLTNAQQAYQHGMGLANARQNADLTSANLAYQATRDAGQARVQGVTAGTQVEMQEAQMAQNERHFNRQMDTQEKHYRDQINAQLARSGYQMDENGDIKPITDAAGRPVGGTGTTSSSASGGGSSTSGNNYAVTVDGQRIVLGMNTETFNAAMQSGKKDIQQDVMDEAGFKGTWDEFVEAASQSKVGKGKDRKDNPLTKYSEIIAALNYNGSDQDEAKSMNAVLEDYVTRNSDTANNFNKHLVNVSNRQRDAVYTSQANQQAAAGAATTPSQQARGRAPVQPTRVEIRDGKLVTVDTATGEVLHEGGSVAPQPQLTWEDKVQWK